MSHRLSFSLLSLTNGEENSSKEKECKLAAAHTCFPLFEAEINTCRNKNLSFSLALSSVPFTVGLCKMREIKRAKDNKKLLKASE